MICLSNDIAKMDDRQLRNEVQLLRDELAIMKRTFADIIYNLDTDNFSSRFTKEQGKMRAAIEFTAKGIKSKVSNDEFQSAMTQTANDIETKVSNLNNTLSSRITQTADRITTEVKSLEESDNELYSQISQTADEIRQEVADVESGLSSQISQTADDIEFRVSKVEDGEFGGQTLFRQTSDTFLFDGEKAVFTGCVYMTDNDDNKAFSIFLNEDSTEYDSFRMWGYGDYTDIPIIIGTTSGVGVYIGDYTDNNRVATRQWVRDNGGSGGSAVAKFG